VVLRTACIKNGKLKIIKIRSGCQYVGYLSLQLKTEKWAAHNLRLGRSLDIAVLNEHGEG